MSDDQDCTLLGEKPATPLLCLPQIPHEQAWHGRQSSVIRNGDQLPEPRIAHFRSKTDCNKRTFSYSGVLSTQFGPLDQDELQENFLVSVSRVNIRGLSELAAGVLYTCV